MSVGNEEKAAVGGFGGVGRPAPNDQQAMPNGKSARPSVERFGGVRRPAPNMATRAELAPVVFAVPVHRGLSLNFDVAVDLHLTGQPQIRLVAQPGEERQRIGNHRDLFKHAL